MFKLLLNIGLKGLYFMVEFVYSNFEILEGLLFKVCIFVLIMFVLFIVNILDMVMYILLEYDEVELFKIKCVVVCNFGDLKVGDVIEEGLMV